MDDHNKQVYLAATILLSAAVGQRHEPVDQKQVVIAVDNARKLYAEVKRQHDEASASLATDGAEKAHKQEAKGLGQH